jgi:hypothetical protein
MAALERYLSNFPQDRLDTILEIRNIVAGVCPRAVERLDRKGITYYDALRGGPVKAGICQILFNEDHLRLAFIHGACLPDPARLLEGETYPKRYVRLESYDKVPWDEITKLIGASAAFDPANLPENQKKQLPDSV